MNMEWVVWVVSRRLSQKIGGSSDAYLRERAADITDVSRRILVQLLAIKKDSLSAIDEDVILVAHDLSPSETLTMNRDRVKGLVLDVGSRTSHTAILARAFGIPAVLGLSVSTREINTGDNLALDGSTGLVLVNPSEGDLLPYRAEMLRQKEYQDTLGELRDLPAQTLDGHRVLLKANIELPQEAERSQLYGAEGIGLFRSEFLFLSPGYSQEEEGQFQAYSQVVRAMKGLPVTIRTIDVGGDKLLPEFQMQEKNPLLGWRAIRFCLSMPELLKTQLRAILRASVFGQVKLMFPMISGVEELEEALNLLEEAKGECRRRGLASDPDMEVGIMIEVPSAALTADILASLSDFFSIGTNDLVQYTLAVDRGNERVSYLAQPLHPSVLRLVQMTIDAAHKRGIPAAMCGELAGDPQAAALLLGLGLDEFSMSAASIPLVKQAIRSCTLENCRALAAKVLSCSSWQHAALLVQNWPTPTPTSGPTSGL
jgi:phosphotransferase system enzyme I (PtsI)